MPVHCSTSHPIVIVGNADDIRDLLCGPPQADEHVKLWRWDCYRAGNYHYWPEFSNRIIYGEREHHV